MVRNVAASLLFLSSLLVSAHAQEPTNVVAAWKGDLEETARIEGRLVPANGTEVSIWLEAYRGELRILEAVEPGSLVNEGDLLLRLDTRPIDEKIQRAEFELQQAQHKLARSEEKGRIEEEASQAAIARAEREADWARRALEGYLTKEKAFKIEQTRLANQSSRYSVEDQQDELEQLERMYEEDELVDATEEIVLKRSRRRLASTVARVKLREAQNAHDLEHSEVLRQERLEVEAEQKTVGLERMRRAAQIERDAREAEMQSARFELDEKRRALERLRGDRERLNVRAPRSGVVIHGTAESFPARRTLERGSSVELFKTLMTVADPGQLQIVTQVPEKYLAHTKSGKAARATVPGVPGLTLLGRLKLDYLPVTGGEKGGNAYRAEMILDESDVRLRPGMLCELEIVLETAKNAVLIPRGAVLEKPDGSVVRCASEADGTFVEKKVVLGPCDGQNVVVREGLSPGEFVKLGEKDAE